MGGFGFGWGGIGGGAGAFGFGGSEGGFEGCDFKATFGAVESDEKVFEKGLEGKGGREIGLVSPREGRRRRSKRRG